uniref:Uncharacterized protein n=1 Tax=Phenylobacterium glaciei TaxID=2803784 RepID=A0A974S890_9CAUL|nr:hypothetical protein JKL49_21505 [Phenylobacterium glaciei]
MSWQGDNFYHRPETGAGHADDHMDYRTWGGACWSAKWVDGQFFHTPKVGDYGHPDTILNFTDWDGVPGPPPAPWRLEGHAEVARPRG